jgi:enediyne biosynthesis protein E4
VSGRTRVLVAGLVALAVVIGIGVIVVGPAVLGGGSGAGALPPPAFVEETATSGIDHTYDGGPTFFTGGGVAVLDCNDDGRPDLYVAGGANPAALYRNDSAVAGALRFTVLPDPTTDLTGVSGAYPIDIDADGHADLVVLRVGGVDLLRGLGDCRFQPADQAWSFQRPATWATAFSATWEGSATLPTLAIGNYVALDPTGRPAGDCADNLLYRPAGGTGYDPPIPLSPGYCTLSILFSEWDGSGRRDLRITNDRHYYVDGEDQLWRVAPGSPPRAYTAADGWVAMQIWGMGIASQDLTGDGLPEVYLTSQGDNKLQTLLSGPGQPMYRDIALKRGVTAAEPFTGGDVLPSTAWHPEFQDVNNDGLVDLFVSKGNVSAVPDYASRDPSNLFIGQADGTFAEGAEQAGILNFGRGRGAALADFNLDGLLDLVEVNLGAPVRVWRNVGSGSAGSPVQMGHWLALRVTEPGGNRDAIGAWVEVRVGGTVQRRELTIGGGHVGGQLGWVHVGLGSADAAEIRVTWPDGELGPWLPATADQFLDVERGATDARPWVPAGG